MWSQQDHNSQAKLEHTHTRLRALCLALPGWAGTRKVKPIWILLKQETVSGSGISWAICKSAPRSRQITMPAPQPLKFFTGQMPFLPCNQQRQSTEGTILSLTFVYLHVTISSFAKTAKTLRCNSQNSLGCFITAFYHLVRTNWATTLPHVTLLLQLTCHMGSHSVTWHTAEVTFPPLPQQRRYSI